MDERSGVDKSRARHPLLRIKWLKTNVT